MKKFNFTINGNKYEVLVNEMEENVAEVEVNGTPFTVEIEQTEKKTVSTPIKKVAGKVTPVATPSKSTANSMIKAQLPGSIIKVLATVGQPIKAGDVLLTMESMKMENSIMAETDGIVKNIMVQPGQSVMQGDTLVEIEGTAVAEAPAAAPVEAPAAPVAKPAAAPAPKPAAKPAGKDAIKAPLPGSIVKVIATVGKAVKRGEVLLTMESMKMENNIVAERDCTVKNILVQPGQSVMQGDTLVDIE